MRHLVVLTTMLIVLACGSAPPARNQTQPQDASTGATVAFLLTSAATDFRSHPPPLPVRFRKVRSGYVTTSDGARQYRLCGEFLPSNEGGTGEWIAFATIKTAPYEQWLGGQALGFCKDASMTWDKKDLSADLQGRVNSPR